MRVLVRDRQRRRIDRRRLRQIGRRAVESEAGPSRGELSVLLTDDSVIQDLNRRYRGVDRPTDVLAFPQEGDELLGDVVISMETAERQAADQGHSLQREVELLLAHGVLHLMGWDDTTRQQRRRMLQRGIEVVDSL
jgi:probable rRNA maturation factor